MRLPCITQQVNGIMINKDDRLIVSVGNSSTRLSFLSGETVPSSTKMNVPQFPSNFPGMPNSGHGSQQQNAAIQAGQIEAKELPEKPSGYEGVDVLVLFDSMSTASPKALNAIGMWVASGGTLVIPAGAISAGNVGSFYSDMLPVKTAGVISLPKIACLAKYGNGGVIPGPIPVLSSQPRPEVCSSMDAEGQLPICAYREFGAGKVVFLAIDPLSAPFKNWSGQTEFWKNIINRSNSGRLINNEELQGTGSSGSPVFPGMPGNSGNTCSNLSDVVAQKLSVQAPSVGGTLLYLLLYFLALVPINYLVLRKKSRLHLAWVTVPGIVIVFTIAAYIMGMSMKGLSIRMNEVSVIEGSSNARYAYVSSAASLFSPAWRSYNIVLSDPYAIAESGMIIDDQGQRAEHSKVFFDGEQCSIEDVTMAMWSSKTFVARSGIDLGGVLTSALDVDGSHVSGQITNNTTLDLDNCQIILGGDSVLVGNLKHGTSISVNGALSRRQQVSTNLQEENPNTRLISFMNSVVGKTNTSFLLARVHQRDCKFGVVGERVAGDPLVYAAFWLDYNIASSGKMTINLSEGKILSGGSFGGSSASSVMLFPGQDCVELFRAPRNSKVENLIVNISLVSGGGQASPKAYLYNVSSGKWDDVTNRHPVENASRYVGDDGSIKLKLENSSSQSPMPMECNVAMDAEIARK